MDEITASSLNQKDFLARLETSPAGLSKKEAARRLEEHGKNQLTKSGHYALQVLGRQLASSLVYLLVVACLISLWLKDFSDATLIAIILLINTGLGFYQEYKSERIVEKLSRFISKQVLVRRNNHILSLDEAEIVPGDLVIIREGDVVTADMRLIEANDLEVNESQLTGESMPVTKTASELIPDNPEQKNASLVFTGSIVERGEGLGVVYATGNDTRLGEISTLSVTTKKETQYEKSLRSFSGLLIKATLLCLVLLFILKILLTAGRLSNIPELLLFIVALAVAVVPEVLPVIATVTMSSGAMKLAKEHVVVKRLSSLEDLGNVTLLCTDKTGTITENRMTITKISSTDQEKLLTLVGASIQTIKNREKKFQSSYDEAFLKYFSPSIKARMKNYAIVKELPFDPEARRRRTVILDQILKKYYLVTIGTPETLLKISLATDPIKYEKDLADEEKSGLRHIAVAYKEITYAPDFDIAQNENGLTFLGYATLLDPLRPTAKRAISRAEKLGITIKILTGDSPAVAEYTGKAVGLIRDGQTVYTGEQLEKMSPAEFSRTVNDHHVFAGVSPRQKYQIIKTLKENNVVAYQGDGINDAPSLKLADVAIAVDGATDIAKENADIVLLSSNLEVIINGIKYGRVIFVNINKYIKYTLVGNWGNFIALGLLYLLSSDLPLLPIQVLLTSVITDIPFVSISTDTVEEADVIRPEKHNPKELIVLPLILGIPTAIFSLVAFYVIRSNSPVAIETILFLLFTMLQMFAFFSVRTIRHFWQGSKPSLILSSLFLLAMLFSFLITYLPPFQIWFHFTALPVRIVASLFLLMFLYLFVIDAVKHQYYKTLEKSGRQ